jgi:peptide/nickel transport system permease protein
MVLVIVFSVINWAGFRRWAQRPGGCPAWDWDHIQYLILPAITMSVIPMGIVSRTVRALVGDHPVAGISCWRCAPRAWMKSVCLRHVLKNAAPTAIAVMGLQLGYLLGGSILIETVFSWPGTGFLLNSAIFQRDLPLLQGTILVLALFFVVLNLIVDVLQAAIDPRIKRACKQ